MRFSSCFALVAATVLLALAPAAVAQSGPDLTALHDALRLTPDQEGAWRAFAAASQPSAEDEARERAGQQMMRTLHAPQRVDLAVSMLEDDLASLRTRGAALKAFYAALTPAQQLIFDRQTLQQPAAARGYDDGNPYDREP
jgi:LTXXQ motif family protein